MTFLEKKTARAIPVTPVTGNGFEAWLKKQDKKTQAWVKSSGFTGATASTLLVPGPDGALQRVVIGVGKDESLYTYSGLPASLPKNEAGYYIDQKLPAARATEVALGWALGAYYFARYRRAKSFAKLVWPENADKAYVKSAVDATYLVRDLVNIPPNDFGPAELEKAARDTAKKIGGKISVISGNDLLKKNYPLVHAVGKGSPRAPRLLDIRWGNSKHKKLTLVGKGVCYDTGGLNIKPGGGVAGMIVQKKDMGGAAHVLALARMIAAAKLPVRLRVLIPAVENSIDGACFRPGDVLQSRKGLTVEIGNTDAEGRLVLADALAEACTEKPDLLIDFATLTGAARTALGPDMPPLISNDERVSAPLMNISHDVQDPLWILPLWRPYADMLGSKIADINNEASGGFAGAITAALFLDRFVDRDVPWVHIDTYAWNPSPRPGRPDGGEALGLRACFAFLQEKYGRR